MTHEELRELIGGYLLGALSEAERAEVEAHLRGCEECRTDVRALSRVVSGLAWAVPQHEPPARLRERVLGTGRNSARVVRVPPRISLAWLAAAAALVCAVAVGWYSWQLRGRMSELSGELARTRGAAASAATAASEARDRAARAEQKLAILAAPDVTTVDLAGQPVAPGARGRAFWSRSRGLLVTAGGLPAPPPGKVYQLWVVTPAAPVSAGLFRPDAQGRVETLVPPPAGVTTASAVAVTLEPEGGVAAPTGAKYLVGVLTP